MFVLTNSLRLSFIDSKENCINQKLFQKSVAILKGIDGDMHRLGNDSHLKHFFRFSFGPLLPDSYDNDIKILNEAINSQKE